MGFTGRMIEVKGKLVYFFWERGGNPYSSAFAKIIPFWQTHESLQGFLLENLSRGREKG